MMKALVLGIAVLSATLSAQVVYHVGDAGVLNPTLVNMPRPCYTDDAVDQRIEGIVKVQVLVRADGGLGEPVVTKSLDAKYGLDENALDVVRHAEFKAGTKDGKPADVEIEINVEYTLRRGA